MTKIKIREGHISVSGHSGYSKDGKDIVCSAVSMLTQSLIESIEALTDDKILYEISLGRVDIYYKNLSDRSKLLIDSFFVGICAIVRTYPQYVAIA